MADVILKLFHGSLMERTDHTYAGYEPVVSEVVARASRWNANLFLLLAMTQNGISMRELFPEKGHGAVYEWHRLSNLWRSCVRGEGWNGLADTLDVERAWVGKERDIVIRVGPPGPCAPSPTCGGRTTFRIRRGTTASGGIRIRTTRWRGARTSWSTGAWMSRCTT